MYVYVCMYTHTCVYIFARKNKPNKSTQIPHMEHPEA